MHAFTSAAVIGATGEIGRRVVSDLLNVPNITKVVTVSRRPLPDSEATRDRRLQQVVLSDFTAVSLGSDQVRDAISGISAAVCVMGTGHAATLQVTPEELRTADYELPLAFAQCARAAQIPTFLLMTAHSADASVTPWTSTTAAGYATYNKTKGLAENAVVDLGFLTTIIARPAAVTDNPNSYGLTVSLLPLFSSVFFGSWTNLTVEELGKGLVRAIQRASAGKALPSSAAAVLRREDGTLRELGKGTEAQGRAGEEEKEGGGQAGQKGVVRVYEAAEIRLLCGEMNTILLAAEQAKAHVAAAGVASVQDEQPVGAAV